MFPMHLIRTAEQIVGRERNQRTCDRQLVGNVVVCRRVNSTVIAPRTKGKTCLLNHGLNGFAFSARLGADETCVVDGAIKSHWTGARSAGLSSARLGCLFRRLRARSIPTLSRREPTERLVIESRLEWFRFWRETWR